MKSKQNLLMVVLHVFVLAGFSLLQGCASGGCFVDYLNWPYNTPVEETVDVSDPVFSDPMFLPPASFPIEPNVAPLPVEVTPLPIATPDQFYTVRKGDTLSGIASMYGTNWKELASYNGIDNPNKLYVGQKIRIDGSFAPAAPVSRPAAPLAEVESKRRLDNFCTPTPRLGRIPLRSRLHRYA